jgi:hypothetical protein
MGKILKRQNHTGTTLTKVIKVDIIINKMLHHHVPPDMMHQESTGFCGISASIYTQI